MAAQVTDSAAAPDSTAVRVALWRALHVEIDPPPHVLVDELGLELAAPEPGWRERPDMHPQGTRQFRASIVAPHGSSRTSSPSRSTAASAST
jgi:hypothetical protein